MTRLACLLALSLAACSSSPGTYISDDAFCLEVAPPVGSIGSITYRASCPEREGYRSVASCDGIAVISVGSGWAGGPGARRGQALGCSIDGTLSCPRGGTPQCTYVPAPGSLPQQVENAQAACSAAGFSPATPEVGICYVDPVTFEVIEIDLESTR